MHSSGLNIETTEEGQLLKVPITRYVSFMVFFGSAAIIFGLLTLSLPYLASTNGNFEMKTEFWGHLFWFPLMLNIAMWFVFGTETIIVGKSSVTIVRSNRILKLRKTFKKEEIITIESIALDNSKLSFVEQGIERIQREQRAIPLWRRMGKIRITTRKTKKSVLNGLNYKQASDCALWLNRELEKNGVQHPI